MRRNIMKTSKAIYQSHRWLTAPAVLFCSLVAGQAPADSSDNAPTVTVSFADLDLSKPEGAETLYQRIQAAARQVCGGSVDTRYGRDLSRRQAVRACYEKALADAIKQVDNSNLLAVAVAAK
jgi:UrcA family protein